MKFDTIYYISQLFVAISYLFLITTYFSKKRKNIIVYNFGAMIAIGIAYVFLNAYTGLAMVFVAMIRNIWFMKFNDKNNKKQDIISLIVIYAITIALTIFTYNGPLSLLSVAATMLYTYSIWQKNTKTYKILGIPIGFLWISYNVYISSIFGIICESILVISALIGFIKQNEKKENV